MLCFFVSGVICQEYLKNCEIYLWPADVCFDYVYNDITCFPWDKSQCETEFRNDGNCLDVFCEVPTIFKFTKLLTDNN